MTFSVPRFAVLIPAIALLVAACGDDSSRTEAESTAGTASVAPSPSSATTDPTTEPYLYTPLPEPGTRGKAQAAVDRAEELFLAGPSASYRLYWLDGADRLQI